MSSRENLDLYLQRARARLKLVLLTQGAALLAGALLVVTVLAGLGADALERALPAQVGRIHTYLQ